MRRPVPRQERESTNRALMCLILGITVTCVWVVGFTYVATRSNQEHPVRRRVFESARPVKKGQAIPGVVDAVRMGGNSKASIAAIKADKARLAAERANAGAPDGRDHGFDAVERRIVVEDAPPRINNDNNDENKHVSEIRVDSRVKGLAKGRSIFADVIPPLHTITLPYTSEKAVGVREKEGGHAVSGGGGGNESVYCDYLQVRIPKTGSTSVWTGLNIAQSRKAHRHIDVIAREEESFDCSFKFTFVRSPYERLLSAFSNFKKWLGPKPTNPADGYTWLKWIASDTKDFTIFMHEFDRLASSEDPEVARHMEFFSPNIWWITRGDGEIPMDFIGRTSEIARDFAELCTHIGCSAEDLPHVMSNPRPETYHAYYTVVTKEIVKRHYRADLEAFGWRYEDGIEGRA